MFWREVPKPLVTIAFTFRIVQDDFIFWKAVFPGSLMNGFGYSYVHIGPLLSC